ncbi:MAG TPA: biotin--[acetyl-CoA-carboxylase] ligase [Bacteroidales bacterium]|jgi:BirA family biotin operon repressor/biotin-[acetyl-CoA-carboxylase] ligase|nr:biotin--[acetyl-CoA-carboxylase] ligase [Bacteroidales bacterium]
MGTNFLKSRPLKLGEPLIKLESVDSTNNYAMNLLRNENPSEGTVILAGYQTVGKGQGGNTWQSERNQNLLFSVILKPDFLKAEKQFYLSMCISNGLSAFIENTAGHSHIKWPNDILLKGKKVAGILIENTIMIDKLHASVAGIGVNVNQLSFPADLPDAVSISKVTGKEYNLLDLLNDLLDSLKLALEPLYCANMAEIRTAYLNRLYRLNEWARYKDDSGTFEGRINDVADTGELIVEKHNGESRLYGFKEINFG